MCHSREFGVEAGVGISSNVTRCDVLGRGPRDHSGSPG